MKVPLLAGKVKWSGTSLVFNIHLNLWMLQQDLHNLKMSKAAGTMKGSVCSVRANPIHID